MKIHSSYRGTNVLDHGYVQFIERWGSDEAVIEAARMSTDKGFLGWDPGECPTCEGSGIVAAEHDVEMTCRTCAGKGTHIGDSRLLRHLWIKRHSTPFEFAGLTIEVKAPLMVFREWHRHRTQSYAERSARYTPLPDENYMPTPERLMRNGGTNKQAVSIDGVPMLTLDAAVAWLNQLHGVYEHCERVYQNGLAVGVPKEIARLSMTVGRYSVMRASTDLRNWLGFASLRLPEDAQWEIREFASVVHTVLSEHFPRTLALFDESFAKPA